MLRPYDVIKRKRDGGRLDGGEIAGFLDGYLNGDVPDYQMSALLMAVYFRGLDPGELAVWTDRMLHSGTLLELPEVSGVKVDKHSTGGVGDKISLPLAGLVAACGVPIPMISGRGLGHTGGTLDKLESIPGFSASLSVRRFREIVREVGVCIMGATADIAPLDRRLYALRDVTATVDSIPLIASSIMSKKLAEGIDALVLDVKTGSGAFMKTVEDARQLAETMVGIGKEMGKRVVALITGMDQPLGAAVGNALEVVESVEVLRGGGPPDVVELTLALGAQMLVLGGVASDEKEALERLRRVRENGSGFETFCRMVAAQGGDRAALEDPRKLPAAQRTELWCAENAGVVQAVDTEKVGVAAMALGAGRARVDSPIDPGVGLTIHARIGDEVVPGTPLVTLHLGARSDEARARALLREAYSIGEQPVSPPPLLVDLVS